MACSDWLKSQGVVTERKGMKSLQQVNAALQSFHTVINKRIDNYGLREVLQQ